MVHARRALGRGARVVSGRGADGAKWVAGQGERLWERAFPRDTIVEQVGGYLDDARKTVNKTVERELRELRRAIRRRRRSIGL